MKPPGGQHGPPADTAKFEEAVKAWRARVPVTDQAWAELTQRARRRAFTVAGVTQLELVADVWRALDAAIERGETFEAFKAAIGEKLTSAWGRERPWRLETVFRTGVQQAYGAGRYQQMTEPAVLRRRPFWKYSAVLDGRTSTFCRPISGTVLPASDPFWSTHQPPLHFSCRSTVIALTADQADKEGVAQEPPELEAQSGFGGVPTDPYEPDLSNVPEPLREAFEARRGTR